MSKLFLILSTVLFALYGFSTGLECYQCYVNTVGAVSERDNELVPCNTANLPASNTITCPEKDAKCVYKVIDIQSPKMTQTLRTWSKGNVDPCDPNNMLPGMKLLECKVCTTDKCNLFEKKENNTNNEFTFNINANVNLYIRQ